MARPEESLSNYRFIDRRLQCVECDAISSVRRMRPLHALTCSHVTDSLTPRQFQVAMLLAVGLSVKEVGAKLNVATKTAEAHRRVIYQTLNIHGIVPLVQLYYRTKHGIPIPSTED